MRKGRNTNEHLHPVKLKLPLSGIFFTCLVTQSHSISSTGHCSVLTKSSSACMQADCSVLDIHMDGIIPKCKFFTPIPGLGVITCSSTLQNSDKFKETVKTEFKIQ